MSIKSVIKVSLIVGTIATISACNSPNSLQQAERIGDTDYRYLEPTVGIIGAPEDTDYTRWAAANDGEISKLVFFKKGSDDVLYQFGYNSSEESFEYGYEVTDTVSILGVGVPSNVELDTSSMVISQFGPNGITLMLLSSKDDPTVQYPFLSAEEAPNYFYQGRSIAMNSFAVPADIDYSRRAMTTPAPGFSFIYYFAEGSSDTLYPFYLRHDFTPIYYAPTGPFADILPSSITIEGSDIADHTSFAMLEGGAEARLFSLEYSRPSQRR